MLKNASDFLFCPKKVKLSSSKILASEYAFFIINCLLYCSIIKLKLTINTKNKRLNGLK